ncbi:STAS domain-containing protein [Streptomyces sp. NPDC018029]|uniref:STAS domain-containing protein n=1 Tax=Streptomyces sp. NPDC018029 TaxID=3365032 RepID=UPI00379D6D54
MPWDEVAMPRSTRSTGGASVVQQPAACAVHGPMVREYECRGARVIAAHGEYDLSSITPLAQALEAAARQYPKVILDASGVTFADSTLLNLLILTHRRGDLRVVAPSPPLQRICEITGLDSILQIRETVEEAALS